MTGTSPSFNAWIYEFASWINIGPLRAWPFMHFGLALTATFVFNRFISCTNSYLSSLSGSFMSVCRFFSCSVGLTNVQQSLSWKKWVSIRRTLFFPSMASEQPFCSLRADSRYCLGVILFPSASTNFNAKSLRTQRNDGNILAIYSSSSPAAFPWSLFPLFS